MSPASQAQPTIIRAPLQHATALCLPDASFAMVRFVVATRQGAVLDEPQRAGALSLMLELLLRGTQRKRRNVFAGAVERLGAQLDCATSHEIAMLRGATLRRHLDAVWALLQEALLEPAFDAEELARLKAENLEALAGDRDDDDAVASYFLRRSLFAGHRLARSAEGECSDIAALSLDHVVAAYRQFCRQAHIVVFAGDIRAEEAERRAAALSAALQKLGGSASPAPLAVAAPQPPPSPRVILVDKPDRTQVQLRLAGLGPVGQDDAVEAFWLGIMAFGGTFTSPYTREIRDIRGWSYVAQADFRRRARLAAPVTLRCAPALGDAVDCLALSLELWQALGAGKLDTQGVESTRQYVLNRYPFEIATAFDMLGGALSQEACDLPTDHLLQLPARLEAIDCATVGATVQQHLHAQAYVALVVAPKEALLGPLQQRFGNVPIDVIDFRAGLAAD